MSRRHTELQLRMDMLRLRAQLQRAEVAAARADLLAGTGLWRHLFGAAARVGAASTGAGPGWFASLVRALLTRPWVAAAAGVALRASRRHPVAALATAAAFIVASVLLRRAAASRGESPAADPPAPPPA